MASILVAGDTSGSVTISAPAVSGSSVLTLPVATDTLVGKTTTDTLTNKTLTSPVLTTPNLGTPSTLVLTNATGLAAAAMPAGSVLQVASTTFDGYVSTSVTGTVPTTITFGYQLFSLSFTPISATSTLLVQTSTVSIGEAANSGDGQWLALWDGSTFIAANSGSLLYSHFAGNLNAGYYALNHSYAAGSTSARTIQVRAGHNGAATIYINGNPGFGLTGSSARLQMTVWEIAG